MLSIIGDQWSVIGETRFTSEVSIVTQNEQILDRSTQIDTCIIKMYCKAYQALHRCLDSNVMAQNTKGAGCLGTTRVNILQYTIHIIYKIMFKFGRNVAWCAQQFDSVTRYFRNGNGFGLYYRTQQIRKVACTWRHPNRKCVKVQHPNIQLQD